MLTTPLRPAAAVAVLFTGLGLLLLGGCGSGDHTVVCNMAGGCCGGNDLCVAPQYLYAAGITGGISSFPINGGTGTLGTPTTIMGPQGTLGMAVMENAFLYVSSAPTVSGGSVYAWTIDLGSGGLTGVSGSPFNLGLFSISGGMAANNDAQVLYVADAGKIDALHADSTGELTAISASPFPSGSELFLAIDQNDQFLFASDTTPPGNVLAYTIDNTGALTEVAGSPFAAVAGSSNTYPYEIAVDGSQKFVYVDLLLSNQVAGFAIDSSTGGLTAVPGSPFSTGNMPLALATVNHFLYVSNSQDGTISGYTIDPSSGVLTPMSGSPFAISAGALTANPSGSFLYTSGRKGLQIWSIDVTTGALTQAGSPVPFAGATILAYVQ